MALARSFFPAVPRGSSRVVPLRVRCSALFDPALQRLVHEDEAACRPCEGTPEQLYEDPGEIFSLDEACPAGLDLGEPEEVLTVEQARDPKMPLPPQLSLRLHQEQGGTEGHLAPFRRGDPHLEPRSRAQLTRDVGDERIPVAICGKIHES